MMNKNEGLCPRRDKTKGKLSKNKLNSKTKLKKRGEPKVKPDIVLDAILLRCPRSGGVPSGLTLFPKKKAKFKIEKEVARRTRTQKIMK
jgi:hypothetical protein